MDPTLLDAEQTAARLPWAQLVAQLRAVLTDESVHVPQRIVQPLAHGASLFVMPAADGRVAIAKLITFTPANAGTGRPTIQGDVVVFDVATGARRIVLDGPTVTARRTAAVSLLAAQQLAPVPSGPLLVIGAGAQGHAHVEAFVQELGVRDVRVASRNEASAQPLADHARALGARAQVVSDPNAALADCPLVVTCTPARGIVLRSVPSANAFVAAVGAFTPQMAEIAPQVCTHCANEGMVVVDTPEAVHEAGDLIQAGLDVQGFPTLSDVLVQGARRHGPVLFKSCGWAGWDLAAARAAMICRQSASPA
jgi:ornithine cyclodeaminase